jgi:hypothetical protein
VRYVLCHARAQILNDWLVGIFGLGISAFFIH